MSTAGIESKQSILRRRAKVLAQSNAAATSNDLVDTVVVLKVGGARFGISSAAFDEIASLSPIAELPGMPVWLPGVAQVRGRIVAVLDLRNWFRLPGVCHPRYLAVVRSKVGSMAILADSIDDVREIRTSEIADTILTDVSRGHRSTTKDLVNILDIDMLLRHPDMTVDHGAAGETT